MDKFIVESMNFYYGDFHALKNINMKLAGNRITAFIGPSGCGKSTFLKTLNRMNDLVEGSRVEGTILLDGDDIYREMDLIDLRTKVGMVFQKPNPFPMSIYDNIAYGPRVHGIKKKAGAGRIGGDEPPTGGHLGGSEGRPKEKRAESIWRTAAAFSIARALATKPEVLLMDEPTSALDPISTLKIEDLILELKQEYTILIVTHNMQQAARVSDYTAFFLLGDVVEYGDTETLFSTPANKKTEDYITGRFG